MARAAVIVTVAAFCLLGSPLLRFTDVSEDWGFSSKTTYGNSVSNTYILESTGNGAAIFDFDGDGRNDILITNGTTLTAADNGPGLLLYHNEGPGHFREVARSSGLTYSGWAQSVCAADIDNDGDMDVAVTYYGVNRLFRNTGGSFEDVTQAAGLPTSGNRWGSGCAWLDYDRDGFVDLFIANYVDLDLERTPKPGQRADCIWKGMPVVCGPLGLPKGRNVLYRNRGDGTFEDTSEKAGIRKPGGRFGLGVASADFNNDGWPDIYVACDQTPSLLYENRRNGTFVERGVEAGVAYNVDGQLQSGMGVAVADLDGNGFLDILKTNFSGDLPSLYLNEDGHFFSERARESGLTAHQLLGWGVVPVDVDEDGMADLMIANGHVYPEIDRSGLGEHYKQLTLLYQNKGGARFLDGTSRAGQALEIPRASRGMAAGDLDGDGRPEMVIVNMNDTPTVLHNETRRGNWIRVVLQGTKSNRSAIGARVTITAAGRKQTAEVAAGGSYYSQNDLALYFGLGTSSRVETLAVRWPSGRMETFRDVPGGQTVTYRER